MVEIVPVGLTGGRIPLARKNTLGALRIVESDMESTDSCEKIDELIREGRNLLGGCWLSWCGLHGHGLTNHNPKRFGSHKWTPVHPGDNA